MQRPFCKPQSEIASESRSPAQVPKPLFDVSPEVRASVRASEPGSTRICFCLGCDGEELAFGFAIPVKRVQIWEIHGPGLDFLFTHNFPSL